MKKSILIFVALLIICLGTTGLSETVTEVNSQKETICILSSPDLINLAENWKNEYSRLNPDLEIKVINITETNTDISKEENLCFISNKYYNQLNLESEWKLVIGRDVIVPVINEENPFIHEIYERGISPDALIQMFKDTENQSWGALSEYEQNVPVNYYAINDELTQTQIMDFLNINPSAIDGKILKNRQELISAIQNDPYAIGFCKLSDIIDLENQNFIKNIKLLPIDRNGNGKIDYMEEIYNDLYSFTRGVWIGKYPKTLINNIYSLSSTKPANESEISFLNWILTDGQQFLYSNGYSDLVFQERQTKLEKLRDQNINIENSNNNYAAQKIILLIIIGLVVTGFIANGIVRYRRNKRKVFGAAGTPSLPVLSENTVNIPKGLYFDKTYTWSFMEKDGNVKVGIDDFLQHITGPITEIKIKDPGDKIKKGEQILTLVQNGKQLNIYAPISGYIRSINKDLMFDSSLINSSPYEKGWVYKIEPINWLTEIQFLNMANKYKEWLKNEFTRLKDFISDSANARTNELAHVVLQDGGELKDNTLEYLGPHIWEDFQTNFIDTSK
ncbi:MAG: hypothetical protein K8R86_13010 [Bacteroidales bacterium]|nr:hypothetical protein [Bacteroidales bacterium]